MPVKELPACLTHYLCVTMIYSGDIDEEFLVTMTCNKQNGCCYIPGMTQKNPEDITIRASDSRVLVSLFSSIIAV